VTVAEAEDRVARHLVEMDWSNLTRPMLDQLARSPSAWKTLSSVVAERLRTGKGQGAVWAASTDICSIDMRINPKGGLRCELKMRTGPSTYGPDSLCGRDLDICGVRLPETILISVKGRRLGEILQSERHLAIVPADTVLRSARSTSWGTRFTLDLRLIRPQADDVAAIRAASDPSVPLFS